MKIVVFKGGIGNQLFQYCLIDYLSRKGYRVYFRDETLGHNGLEIHKYFDVKLKRLPRIWDYIYRKIKEKYPSIFNCLSTLDDVYDESKIRFDGYWQDKDYMSPELDITFKKLPLNERNKEILDKIQSTNSVSIHVRRGDYLKYLEIYGGICTAEYYTKALAIIKERIATPTFYVFSDDIEWCRENMNITNAEYIDWNKGNDSIYDMYLMSKCKANIIANSTFSFWGAIIADNDIVIYPKKWFANKKSPDLFKKTWLGI
ncbi:MAG: alpha-1,2-fucosyltransferase [Prevotella sp.]|nr:alpha-1,2-fucosyltransferase [Prevotella sp.]